MDRCAHVTHTEILHTLQKLHQQRFNVWWKVRIAIGAGWYDQEYKAYGYDYPSAGVRLKMLEEALQIYIAMTTQDKASFEGDYYKLKMQSISQNH